MSVTEVLGAQGQWSVQLSAETPEHVRRLFGDAGIFSHVAIVGGSLDVDDHGDALRPAARYVGIFMEAEGEDGLTLTGAGMLRWLGDEDGKGGVLKTPVAVTGATLSEALTAVLPAAVPLGTVHPLTDPAARYTNTHVFQSPREAVQVICDAFKVEYRVTNVGTLEVGRPDQLYNTTAPDTIIKRRANGSDVDLTAIGGSYRTEVAGWDYTTEVLLLGQTTGVDGAPDELFVTASRSAPVVPYKDMHGNPVRIVRIISESGQTEGSADVRAQLHLNRFNRLTRALAVTADQFEAGSLSGAGGVPFVVGDATYVYDPASGVTDPTREVYFRGDVLNPDVIRVTEVTWPITDDYTVAVRTGDGAWVDLTEWVVWEGADTGSDSLGVAGVTKLRVGDLATSVTSPSGNQAVQDRVDASRPSAPDSSIPKTPTGLTLTTQTGRDTWGNQIAFIRASWAAVTQNTDNTPFTDFARYEIRYRWKDRAPSWSGSDVTGDTTVEFVAVNGLVYDVEVRAVDKSNNASDWSGTASIEAATDDGPPPAPADPIVSNYLGQLRIEYSGVSAAGTLMPADTLSIEVYVSETAEAPLSGDDRVADLNPFTRGHAYATAPYFQGRWVRFIAVDVAGNRGPSSAAVLGGTWNVVSEDIFVGAVGTLQLAELAVTTAKINDLAVNNAKIGNMSVGKLTAGIMTADVTIAGRFATALTGARVEVNSLGLQKYAANGTLLVNITGTEALLTGVIKTAATGRRIEIGAGGQWGQMNLFAPDNQFGFLRTVTTGPGSEALQLGMGVAGGDINWNVLGYNTEEFASYRTKRHDFLYQDSFRILETTNRGLDSNQKVRLSITPAQFSLSAGSAAQTNRYFTYDYLNSNIAVSFTDDSRFQVLGTFSTTASPGLSLTAPDGFGSFVRAVSDNRGPWLEVRNTFDTDLGAIRASFIEGTVVGVGSDARDKKEIVDFSASATSRVKGTKTKRYHRGDADKMELGLLAQEAPPEIVLGDEKTGLSISLYAMATLLWKAQQETDDRLAALEKSGKAPK